MGSVPPLLLIGTALICLGDLLHIIGLGTPHWEEVDGPFDIHFGLFKYCARDNCDSFDSTTSKLEAVQAMVIIGMLCGLLSGAMAIIFVLLNLLSKAGPKIMTLVCAGAAIVAFVFIIIGVIVYAAEIHDSDNEVTDLGYSFALCIVGAILLGLGGILVFVGAKSVG